jgi:hypothetical protein
MNPPVVRLYRYLKAEHALKIIRDREFRVSRLAELNDPFEFMPGLPFVHPTWPHDIVDKQLGFLVDALNPKYGIICFSERISDPVVWSHYSDGHKGAALGFDVFCDDSLFQIKYPSTRPTIDMGRIETMTEDELLAMMRGILSAKAPSWSYEAEYRVFVDLAKCRIENGHYFHKIPDDCFKQVVLGVRCTVHEAQIESALSESNTNNVAVVRARRCPTNFKLLI